MPAYQYPILAHTLRMQIGSCRLPASSLAPPECAKEAGYAQLELDVAAQNERAITLYESEGFAQYGRNPKGFRSRYSGWQELVLMRLELLD